MFDDVFRELEHPDGNFPRPSAYDPSESLLSFLQRLKGFDSEAMIEAMSSTANNVIVAWDRYAV